MKKITFSELYTLTNDAKKILNFAVNNHTNRVWSDFINANPSNLITPLAGANAGEAIDIPSINGGVYIWGINLVCEDYETFLPLYVGKTEKNCIEHILKNHLNASKGDYSCYGTKALFQVPKCNNIKEMYECLKYYNNLLIGANAATISGLMGTFFNPTINPFADWVIFFHNRAFYENKLTTCVDCNPNPILSGYHVINEDDQFSTLKKLIHNQPSCLPAMELATKIIESRNNITSNICFTYVEEYSEDGISMPVPLDDLNYLEKKTKDALTSIGIHTMSMANSNDKTLINVDFANIQNELVNVSGTMYPVVLNIII
jgi:hypothetical protein